MADTNFSVDDEVLTSRRVFRFRICSRQLCKHSYVECETILTAADELWLFAALTGWINSWTGVLNRKMTPSRLSSAAPVHHVAPMTRLLIACGAQVERTQYIVSDTWDTWTLGRWLWSPDITLRDCNFELESVDVTWTCTCYWYFQLHFRVPGLTHHKISVNSRHGPSHIGVVMMLVVDNFCTNSLQNCAILQMSFNFSILHLTETCFSLS